MDEELKQNRIIIAGGRDFNNYPLLKRKMSIITSNLPHDSIEVVCGGARGADFLGERWAMEMGHPIKYFIPDWEGNGKAAGHIRNRQMGDYASHLVAFWDGQSTGTMGMLKYAHFKGLETRVIYYKK